MSPEEQETHRLALWAEHARELLESVEQYEAEHPRDAPCLLAALGKMRACLAAHSDPLRATPSTDTPEPEVTDAAKTCEHDMHYVVEGRQIGRRVHPGNSAIIREFCPPAVVPTPSTEPPAAPVEAGAPDDCFTQSADAMVWAKAFCLAWSMRPREPQEGEGK